MTVKKYLREAGATVTSTAADLKFNAERVATSARDKVINGVDTSVAAVKNTYNAVTGTIAAFTYAGIAIAFVVAPIPMMVGVGMLYLMELSLKAEKTGIDKSLKDTKNKREFDRLASLLKRHGRIPSDARVETSFIKMQINAQEGFADGEILRGHYKSQKLSELDDEAIMLLIEHAPDKETSDLIGAYYSFKNTKLKS